MSATRRAVPLCAALLLGLALGGSAWAEPAGSPYRINLAAEGSLTGTLGAAVILLPRLLPPEELAEPPCRVLCDPDDIWLPLDRQVIGNSSPAASLASDILVGALISASLTGSLIDGAVSESPELAAGWGKDLLVAFEVLLLAEGLAQLTKYLVRRPRPYAYLAASPRSRQRSRQANLSFFSGHAALAFGAASVLSYTTWARHPDSDTAKGLVLGLSLATASATAYLRVASGNHFWSDVIVGALVGSGLGVLIPALHAEAKPARDGSVAALRLPLFVGFAF